jgi:hypothetical protein
MKNKIFLYCFTVLTVACSLSAARKEGLLKQSSEPKIFVNNRILAKVNGKPVTTYDVMKKMDLIFYKQYPEYTSSTDARYQFYLYNWNHELEQFIMKELILADAKESKVEVSGGDLRQEMESMFGPNTIANLDKIGMSYDDAAKIVEGDIIIRRMLSGRVNSKAMGVVTPSKIKIAYEEFISNPDNIAQDVWYYRVVTIKERDIKKTEESANKAYADLKSGVPLTELVAHLKEEKIPSRQGKVTLSEVIQSNDKELSESYKNVLVTLTKDEFSAPFAVKSRVDKTTVHRILFLVDKIKGEIPSYKDLEPKLKDELLNVAYDKESEVYLEKLKQHFHVRDNDLKAMLPTDYQPFMLK